MFCSWQSTLRVHRLPCPVLPWDGGSAGETHSGGRRGAWPSQRPAVTSHAVPFPCRQASGLASVAPTHNQRLHGSQARGERYGAPGINKLQSSRGAPGSRGRARRCQRWGLLSCSRAEPGPGGQPAPPPWGPQAPACLEPRPLLQEPRQGSGLAPSSTERGQSPPSPPAAPSAPQPRCRAASTHQEPGRILHPQGSTTQLPGRAGNSHPAPQLQLLNALSPQLRVTMPMPMSIPIPSPNPHPQPSTQQRPGAAPVCPSAAKAVPKPGPLAVPGTETADPQRLHLKSFISCSRSVGGRHGGVGERR